MSYFAIPTIAQEQKTIDDMISKRKEMLATDTTGVIHIDLANWYYAKANSSTDVVKERAFADADRICVEAISRFPQVAELAAYYRALIREALDPDGKQGLAYPYYEDYIRIATPKAEKGVLNAPLKSTYKLYCVRLISYYLDMGDKAKMREYAKKLQIIEPDNDISRQINN